MTKSILGIILVICSISTVYGNENELLGNYECSTNKSSDLMMLFSKDGTGKVRQMGAKNPSIFNWIKNNEDITITIPRDGRDPEMLILKYQNAKLFQEGGIDINCTKFIW